MCSCLVLVSSCLYFVDVAQSLPFFSVLLFRTRDSYPLSKFIHGYLAPLRFVVILWQFSAIASFDPRVIYVLLAGWISIDTVIWFIRNVQVTLEPLEYHARRLWQRPRTQDHHHHHLWEVNRWQLVILVSAQSLFPSPRRLSKLIYFLNNELFRCVKPMLICRAKTSRRRGTGVEAAWASTLGSYRSCREG